MLKDVVRKILNDPTNGIRTCDYELVNMYFDRNINIEYAKIVIEGEEIFFINSNNKRKINEDIKEEYQVLYDLLKNSNDYIRGSQDTIWIKKLKELWNLLYLQSSDLLIVPCYITKSCIYLVCLKDFICVMNEYEMNSINANNTLLDEYPLLYFILKHSLFNHYFDQQDIAWSVIMGCGTMMESVKIINNLFEYLNMPGLELYQELSNMPYEGAKNLGVIDFVDEFRDVLSKYKLEFVDKCVIFKNQGRVLRKYLQISDENQHLIATKYRAIEMTNQCWIVNGIGTTDDSNKLCSIIFQGNSKWSCVFNNEIIKYNGTEYELQIKNRAKKSIAYEGDIRITFDEKISKNIINVIHKVKEQSHGTMIIISEDAKSESRRLGEIHRAIRIKELNMTNQESESIMALTSIDGALMMDKNCICYSIGTILDGNAEIYSNLARGSRYNSAYAYIYNMKNKNKKSAAVVISEDGMVDVITTDNIKNDDNDMYRNIMNDENKIMLEEIMEAESREQQECYKFREFPYN